MSYDIRWRLAAFRPITLDEFDLNHLSQVYRKRVEDALTKGTGQQYKVWVRWSDGALSNHESWSWRESDEAMDLLSRQCPEMIWRLHAQGEEHKQWAVYAYRGVLYQVDMPEWKPPVPNMNRLPKAEAMELPRDPLSAEAALRIALDQMKHLPTCPAVEQPPLIISSHCTCPYGEVAKSLGALETQRLRDRQSSRE